MDRPAPRAVWPRLLLLVVILVLLMVALLRGDLVHSDPGIPIEDLPIVMGAMAIVSYALFRPKYWVCREAIPGIIFIGLALGLWFWERDQYRRADAVQVDHVSVVFPGLYFPQDSLRYTFTALVGTDRPEDEAARELLRRIREQGVPVVSQRVHFLRNSPPDKPQAGPTPAAVKPDP